MLTEDKSQEVKKVDNSAYREKFRFLFYSNENVIVERFFKINGFNAEVLHSRELRDAIYEIVYRNPKLGLNIMETSCYKLNSSELEKIDDQPSLRDDMVSKSRIYSWYDAKEPLKLTGFKDNGMGFNNTKDCRYFNVDIKHFNENELVFTDEKSKTLFENGTIVKIKDDTKKKMVGVRLEDGSLKTLGLYDRDSFNNNDVIEIVVKYNDKEYTLKAYKSVSVTKNEKSCDYISYYKWDGNKYQKISDYLNTKDEEIDENSESEENLNPYDVTIKFSLQMANEIKTVGDRVIYNDYKPIYECIFDASQFQRYIRTNINIANSSYSDRSKSPYWRDIDKRLIDGRIDLIYHIIKKICEVTNLNEESDNITYIKSEKYTNDDMFIKKSGKVVRDKVYTFSPSNKKVVDSWRSYTQHKTNKYMKTLYQN